MTPLPKLITSGETSSGKSTLIEQLRAGSGSGIVIVQNQNENTDREDQSQHSGQHEFLISEIQGGDQFSQALATRPSTPDSAILVVDASKGIVMAARHYTHLISLFGIQNVILAVNKMDLVNWEQAAYDCIVADIKTFLKELESAGGAPINCVAIPISALTGDNISEASQAAEWYHGPTLLAHMRSVRPDQRSAKAALRLCIQDIDQETDDGAKLSGQVVSGEASVGDKIRILPSAKTSSIKSLTSLDGESELATAGQAVTVTLDDPIKVSRGNVICAKDDPAEAANQFETTIIWMADDEMLPGRTYILKSGAQTVHATLATPKHKINAETLEQLAAKNLQLNEIGVCNISLNKRIAFDAYEKNHSTGSFFLLDRDTKARVGFGMIHFALRRSSNIHWQSVDVDKATRSDIKAQKPAVLWFTGLSGSGKSAIANFVDKKLLANNCHTYLLDGDNIRHGLNKDLGFTDTDRVENIRRIAEVSGLMVDAGLITLVSFISPFQSERRLARELLEEGEFVEIFVDTPLHVAEERDVKGLYKKARLGEIKNFTGIDSPYEPPENPEIRVDTTQFSVEDAADSIIEYLKDIGLVDFD